jgi:hypothetical protein
MIAWTALGFAEGPLVAIMIASIAAQCNGKGLDEIEEA